MHGSFHRLVRIYIAILAAITVLVTVGAAFLQLRAVNTTLQQKQSLVLNRVSDTVNRYQEMASDMAGQITATSGNVTNLETFFREPLADYANFAIDQSRKTGQYYFVPTEANTALLRNPSISALRIQLQNGEKVYAATQANKGGQVHRGKYTISGFTLTEALNNPQTLANVGMLALTFSQTPLKRDLDQINTNGHIQAVVVSGTDRLLFHFSDAQVGQTEARVVTKQAAAGQLASLLKSGQYQLHQQSLDSGLTVYTLMDQAAHRQQEVRLVLPILAVGGILLLLILALLFTFRNYQVQLTDMVTRMHKIGGGRLTMQLNDHGPNEDLNILADGVNDMLAEINQYVYEIYQLKISQQEANMKALQSQINPHFMYNTLEYIRMAAVAAGQRELAQVVFSFGSLLRNNTDQQATTTVGQEVAFVEKYIFLYQIRYPDQLAYQIQIDDAVRDVVIPKFTIQPLVENYFVHGVNFAEMNNAIEIRAHRVGRNVAIAIINNGKDLSDEEVARVNQKVVQPIVTQPESIGLQNVYARLVQFFGESVSLTVQHNAYHGITTMVTFELPERQGDADDSSRASGR